MQIRQIKSEQIQETVYQLFLDSCVVPDAVLRSTLAAAHDNEELPQARETLRQLIDNIDIAKSENMPLCQDTGMAVVFVEIGQDVHITGEYIVDTINKGVCRAYEDGYFRKSVLGAIDRINTKDNTPAIVHTSIVQGDRVKISVAPKGFGSENMSRIEMITPAKGVEGIKDFVLDTVKRAGGNPCPPISLGIGIGGTFELAALNAKRALLRPLGEHSHDTSVATLEQELLGEINKLGIGPMGLGGVTTALAVNIIEHPTHLAGLPVAINVQCNCVRHKEAII